MAVFAVISQPNPVNQLSEEIVTLYPEAHLRVDDNVWLIAAKATANEVSDKLGVTDGSKGSAVILEVASYFGRANPAIWTWIKNKWEGA